MGIKDYLAAQTLTRIFNYLRAINERSVNIMLSQPIYEAYQTILK